MKQFRVSPAARTDLDEIWFYIAPDNADAAGQIIREASLPNTRPALAQLLVDFPRATVALEAGTHRP
jgi:plasmid stabilization system protein ParE